jgi:hypothetical protein
MVNVESRAVIACRSPRLQLPHDSDTTHAPWNALETLVNKRVSVWMYRPSGEVRLIQ